MTPQNKEQYYHSENIQIIEEQLITIWGHLLDSTTTVVKLSTSASVPIPPPMPPPC